MKKFMLILSAIALFVSCDKGDDPTSENYGLYVTSDSYGKSLISGASVTYYEDITTVVIDDFAFTPGFVSPTVLPIVVTATLDSNTTTISAEGVNAAYKYMGMDATGEVNGLSGEINSGVSEFDFTIDVAAYGTGAVSSYPCSYKGAVSVVSSSDEGLYKSDGTFISNTATVNYNAASGTLTIDTFKFASAMPDLYASTLSFGTTSIVNAIATGYSTAPIYGVSLTDVTYSTATCSVSDITGFRTDDKIRFEFTITVPEGESYAGTYSYTYYGSYTTN